jgi:hypothetical protein
MALIEPKHFWQPQEQVQQPQIIFIQGLLFGICFKRASRFLDIIDPKE